MLEENVATLTKYEMRKFPALGSLTGITQVEIEEHLKLYAGYVTNTNLLREKLAAMTLAGQAGSPEYAELTRRLGFEYNGMRLHELYFENLSGGAKRPSNSTKNLIGDFFGNFTNFEEQFRKVAAIRGVGWVILYKDPVTGWLSIHWISMHEEGHPVGFTPILVMDCWEHAWTAYLKPTERAKYIGDFLSNIDWDIVEDRVK